jgi:lysophospholipid hydrolase
MANDDTQQRLLEQATPILNAIERRTAHITAQMRLAVNIVLNRKEKNPLYLRDLAPLEVDIDRLSIFDIERYARHWAHLVPGDDAQRAALAHILAARHPFAKQDAPHTLANLGLNDAAMHTVYAEHFGQPITALFQEEIPGLSQIVTRYKGANARDTDTVDSVLDSVFEQDIDNEMDWLLVRRGDNLFKQGDVGDSLFIVLDGRLCAATQDGDTGAEHWLQKYGRGAIVGEMSLLTGEPRSATLYAVRDSEVCRLSRVAFDTLVEKHPTVMNQLTVQMARRLHDSETNTGVQRLCTIAVVPISDGVAEFAHHLTQALMPHGLTRHLNRDTLTDLMGDLAQSLDDDVDSPLFLGWLGEQETRYAYVIYEADRDGSPWTRRCIQQADRVLLVGRAHESSRLTYAEDVILHRQPERLRVPQELVLLHDSHEQQPQNTLAWLETRQVTRHHHIVMEDSNDLARLVRFLRGEAVSVVFGGGGLRGAAHIGVIRALNEAGIRADLVGGTSVGSYAAALYALGLPIDDLLKTVRDRLIRKDIILDFTLPMMAFNAGHKLTNALKDIFGDQRLEDLWTPCFIITSNVSEARMMVHRQGLIRRYVRASSALPGIYPPILDDNGDVLVDGSIFNIVPADVADAITEGGPVIAVDVDVMRKSRHYEFGDSVNGWSLFFKRINPFMKTPRTPSMMKMLMRTSILAGSSVRIQKAGQADLLLRPPVEEFGLFDVDPATFDQMHDIGYAYAQEQLAAWQRQTRQDL